jgi:hypothetical protein
MVWFAAASCRTRKPWNSVTCCAPASGGTRTRQPNQRLQKTLEDTNIKLDSAISDTVGVSGRAMINALIDGETDPGWLGWQTSGSEPRRTSCTRPCAAG